MSATMNDMLPDLMRFIRLSGLEFRLLTWNPETTTSESKGNAPLAIGANVTAASCTTRESTMSCVAPGCNLRSKGDNRSDIIYHCFPSDEKRRRQWEIACGRKTFPKQPRLCSRHFAPDAFEAFSRHRLVKELIDASHRRRLKPNAVPTIFFHDESRPPRIASENRAKNRKRRDTLAVLLGREQPDPAYSSSSSSGEPSDTTRVEEESDQPPVRLVHRAASVQCSDRATQTVQCPADLGYHLYARTHGIQSQSWFTQSDPEYNSGPDEENCPGITFDVSEFTFPTDDENDVSNQEGVEVMKENNSSNQERVELLEENNCSNEEGEEKEVIADSDSDQLESDDSVEGHLNLRLELPKSLRQLCQHCGGFFVSCKTHTCKYVIKPFSCDTCGKRYLHERSLKTHRNIHKESYEHPCKFCLVAFKTRLAKLVHERAHKRSPRPYTCPVCPVSFVKLVKRNLHKKGHRGPKIFSCRHCALEFPSLHSLDRHIVVHTGIKLFVCNFCSRTFNKMGHLNSHLRLHTNEKPYQCQHCDRRFNHNVSLKNHVVRYHKGTSQENE